MVRLKKPLTAIVAAAVLSASLTGCALRHTVPGYCIGNGWQDSRDDKEPINFLRLRQEPPLAYRLDSRDVLGIYIEGVLGSSDEPPPVHFPEAGDDTPPAIGYPVPVREDGTVSLPLVEPIDIRGLTLSAAEEKIRNTYIRKKILRADRERSECRFSRKRGFPQTLSLHHRCSRGSCKSGNDSAGADITRRKDLDDIPCAAV